MREVQVHDERACMLGEGALWHPERGQLFWFDILAGKLLSRSADGPLEWSFGECVSAAGWVDRDRLLIASETGLSLFDIATGERTGIAAVEADDASTRSNDGRADPFGGFWFGTMGKKAEQGRGAIYRFNKGRVEKLFDAITIPNAICFAPDGRRAYYADTTSGMVYAVKLDREGWPAGEPEVFIDLTLEDISPDGAVTDAEGCLWNAQWGASRVACYAPDGSLKKVVSLPAAHVSCPAFGGADFSTLFVTSALENIPSPRPADGLTYAVRLDVSGRPEPAVLTA
ncbi:SMP-30/gluconolactonase/LRE family protein [Georhizobium profundi]|uniref:SMP-30/gluconolactonase/LRE family protein n=2 Tax=Georhizobium profundi TaxID=2341112 RepID=A0A3Q8XPP2_9HYPH|nr:SMP-30/gluconolactonase/LRE family protein [Georhizobium profundi]